MPKALYNQDFHSHQWDNSEAHKKWVHPEGINTNMSNEGYSPLQNSNYAQPKRQNLLTPEELASPVLGIGPLSLH
jgi:hypothetical protein